MQKLKCIIWDLDETLLDTSGLKRYRDRRDWPSVRRNLGRVKEYNTLLEIYRELHKKYYSVIVTNSPNWYGEKLLKTFNIKTNLFLGYGATSKHKPNPAPFLRAMKKLRVTMDECIAIGDSEKDYLAAKHSSISFIGVAWGETTKSKFVELGADYIISNPNELIKIISI